MLKSFRTNFNKTNLLRSKYKFYLDFGDEQIVHFRFPTFGELYDKVEEIDATLYLMNANPKDFDKEEMGFVAKNTYELFWGTMKLSPFYAEKIKVFFNTYFEETFEFRDYKMFLGNTILTEERFNIIVLMFLIATGVKDFSEWTTMWTQSEKNSQLDELSSSILQKMAQNNEKIKKTKENKQNQKTTDLDMIMLSIVNEIQSISLDDIFDMNYFTFMWYYSNLNKLIENKIQIVAAGNGLVKNFNYLT